MPHEPVVLASRPPRTQPLHPSKAAVRQMFDRVLQGPEKEPQFNALIDQLAALDFRDYPEEYAQVVGHPGWLYNLEYELKTKFRGNDEPAFVEAMLAYYESTPAAKVPPARVMDFSQLLGYMTNSPALIRPLIRGLDDSSDIFMFNGCLVALKAFPTRQVAHALVERSKVATDIVVPGEDYSRRVLLHSVLAQLRSPEILTYLESELAQTTDATLALHLRAAITGSKQGWPRVITAEQWKILKEQ